jgi:hypothetical protein
MKLRQEGLRKNDFVIYAFGTLPEEPSIFNSSKHGVAVGHPLQTASLLHMVQLLIPDEAMNSSFLLATSSPGE